MSGHSKWATIHRQKDVNDSKRSAIFTKLSQAIAQAVRLGGGVSDPDKNFKLRLAVDRARQFNMPKENIHRAIERGVGPGESADFSELTFEGFLPHGVVVLIDVLTDNKLRTNQQLREILDRSGGSLGGSGAVSYLFSEVGQLFLCPDKLTSEDELKIIDLGVDDIAKEPGHWTIFCHKENTYATKEKLEQLGFVVESAEVVKRPNSTTSVSDLDARQIIESVLDKLADQDDVLHVWTNYA